MFKDVIQTTFVANYKLALIGVLFLLICSLCALLLAPLLMPPDYSWISHTTSESAAQGIAGAWLARLGFVLYGMAVLWLSVSLRGAWGKGALVSHVCFGVMMVSTAAFSIRPWMPGLEFDHVEDFLHSFTSTAMGFAFVFGVLVVFFQRAASEYSHKLFDFLAVVVATLLPLGIFAWPDISGLLQRFMFLVAYLWYGKESLRLIALTHCSTGTASK